MRPVYTNRKSIPRFCRVPVIKPAQGVRPDPSEISGNDKNSGFRCPHSFPEPWSGSPVRVTRRGNCEGRNRPPAKTAHGSAALENAQADAPRGVAPTRARTTEYAPERVWMVSSVERERFYPLSPRQKGGKICLSPKYHLASFTTFPAAPVTWLAQAVTLKSSARPPCTLGETLHQKNHPVLGSRLSRRSARCLEYSRHHC